jgi:hypothetical protein
MTAPIFIVFFFSYPETSADNILRCRAQRLRKLTGRNNIKSKSEIDQKDLRASEVFIDAIIKPIEIMVKDPAVAFANIYASLPFLVNTHNPPNNDTVRDRGTDCLIDISDLWDLLFLLRSFFLGLPSYL